MFSHKSFFCCARQGPRLFPQKSTCIVECNKELIIEYWISVGPPCERHSNVASCGRSPLQNCQSNWPSVTQKQMALSMLSHKFGDSSSYVGNLGGSPDILISDSITHKNSELFAQCLLSFISIVYYPFLSIVLWLTLSLLLRQKN